MCLLLVMLMLLLLPLCRCPTTSGRDFYFGCRLKINRQNGHTKLNKVKEKNRIRLLRAHIPTVLHGTQRMGNGINSGCGCTTSLSISV